MLPQPESKAARKENIHGSTAPLQSSKLINLLRSRRLVLGHIPPSFHPLLSLLKCPCLDTVWWDGGLYKMKVMGDMM